MASLLPLLQYTEYPSPSASTSSFRPTVSAAGKLSETIGILSRAGLFRFKTEGEGAGEEVDGEAAVVDEEEKGPPLEGPRPAKRLCRRSLRGGEDGEQLRVSGEEDESAEVLQKRAEETLEGENTGEFDTTTEQDMISLLAHPSSPIDEFAYGLRGFAF